MKPTEPPANPRYFAVLVPDHGPAECRSYEYLDDMLADLREAFPRCVQLYAFQGGKRLPTTRPPVRLQVDWRLHPLYETPAEPEMDSAGFLNAGEAEDFASSAPAAASKSASSDADSVDVFDDFEDLGDAGSSA